MFPLSPLVATQCATRRTTTGAQLTATSVLRPGVSVASVTERSFVPRRTPQHAHRSVAGGLARVAVFGVSDGLVSNLSLILGFAGANTSAGIVRLAGAAGALAGAISMAAGEWVSISAQNELVEREVTMERHALRHEHAAETDELAAIYESHGMTAAQARAAAVEVMKDHEAALAVHTREELGIDPGELASAWRAAGLSLVCFIVGALIPLGPWVISEGRAATIAAIAIGVVSAAIVGALIGRFAERNVVKSALRQVFILLLACGATYLVGRLIGVNLT